MMQIAQDRGWKAISGVEAVVEQGLAVSGPDVGLFSPVFPNEEADFPY